MTGVQTCALPIYEEDVEAGEDEEAVEASEDEFDY